MRASSAPPPPPSAAEQNVSTTACAAQGRGCVRPALAGQKISKAASPTRGSHRLQATGQVRPLQNGAQPTQQGNRVIRTRSQHRLQLLLGGEVGSALGCRLRSRQSCGQPCGTLAGLPPLLLLLALGRRRHPSSRRRQPLAASQASVPGRGLATRCCRDASRRCAAGGRSSRGSCRAHRCWRGLLLLLRGRRLLLPLPLLRGQLLLRVHLPQVEGIQPGGVFGQGKVQLAVRDPAAAAGKGTCGSDRAATQKARSN